MTALFLNTSLLHAQILTEGFDNVSSLTANGWAMQNNSVPLGSTGWFQGDVVNFTSFSGAPNAYVSADYRNTATSGGTISNWLMTPVITFQNGDSIIFYTRCLNNTANLERLQLRMSATGPSTNIGTGTSSVGDFTTLLLDVNPMMVNNYPVIWTKLKVIITGMPAFTLFSIKFICKFSKERQR